MCISNQIQVKQNAYFIAFILCVNTFSKVLGIFITIPYNIVLMETLALWLLVRSNNYKLLLKKPVIVILAIVSIIMGISLLLWQMDNRVIERLLKFIMYAVFAMICIQYPFDEYTLVKATFTIGIIHALYLILYATPLLNSGAISLDDTMDLSYTSLIYLFAGTIVASEPREKKVIKFSAFALCLTLLFFLFAISTNRGALIAAAWYFVLRFLERRNNWHLRLFFLICIAIACIVVYKNLIPLLEAVDKFTEECGLQITPLKKTIWQMNYGEIDSGRSDNYIAAIQLIKSTFFTPNGVASYEIMTHAAYYPHNIFFEAGVELGVFGFILAGIIIVKALWYMLIKQDCQVRLVTILFCLSIPRLLVSSSYWENSYIWPLMVVIWSNSSKNIYTLKESTCVNDWRHSAWVTSK